MGGIAAAGLPFYRRQT